MFLCRTKLLTVIKLVVFAQASPYALVITATISATDQLLDKSREMINRYESRRANVKYGSSIMLVFRLSISCNKPILVLVLALF